MNGIGGSYHGPRRYAVRRHPCPGPSWARAGHSLLIQIADADPVRAVVPPKPSTARRLLAAVSALLRRV
ncbi:MAG TPA: hypothetical protein VJ872_08555 [Nocardioides sp.]|nr:hypothetical protein [Nocardioides sp.]